MAYLHPPCRAPQPPHLLGLVTCLHKKISVWYHQKEFGKLSATQHTIIKFLPDFNLTFNSFRQLVPVCKEKEIRNSINMHSIQALIVRLAQSCTSDLLTLWRAS